jgi:hypothetical protein
MSEGETLLAWESGESSPLGFFEDPAANLCVDREPAAVRRASRRVAGGCVVQFVTARALSGRADSRDWKAFQL